MHDHILLNSSRNHISSWGRHWELGPMLVSGQSQRGLRIFAWRNILVTTGSVALHLICSLSSAPGAGVENVEYFHILLHTYTSHALGYNGIDEYNTIVISNL